MQLLDLPNELLLDVTNQSERIPDFSSLVRTCSRLYQLLLKPLYDEDFRRQNSELLVHFTPEGYNDEPASAIQRRMSKGANLGPECAFYLRRDFKGKNHATCFATR